MAMMDALRQRAEVEGYETFVLDAQEVLDGLETILAADIVEDVVEEALRRRSAGRRGPLEQQEKTG